MKQSVKVFYWGMMISFLGSLPPGVMNIVGTQISGSRGMYEAFCYAAGFMLAEAILVRIALAGMNRLIRSKKFFHLIEWMTAGMLIVFSIACFITANSMQEFSDLPGFLLSSFVTGVVISIINPMHIPFWLGWSAVLMNKGILTPRAQQYYFYIAGIGIGTLAGFSVFIFGGQQILKVFQSNQYLINCIIGFALFVTAFFHIRKMIFVPAAVRHAKLFRQP
jgi:threonine/homoserine/homoserine lactone efflux protein